MGVDAALFLDETPGDGRKLRSNPVINELSMRPEYLEKSH
jgi:hypothetical protein